MTESVLIAGDGMSADVIEQTAEVCHSVGVAVIERGDDPTARAGQVTAIVASLPAGARRVPDRIAALAELHGARVILLSAEPLVRPVVTLCDGALVIVSPPFDRPRLLGAVRGDRTFVSHLADGSTATELRAFENLRRASWVAWQRGPDAPLRVDVHHPEGGALTAVVQLTPESETGAGDIARLIDDVATDGRCEAQLWALLGVDAAVVRLTPSADEWLLYWPRHDHPISLSSPHRLPSRWSIADALVAARRRMQRLPAYPGDLLVALVDPDAAAARAIDAGARFLAGGPDARASVGAAAGPRLTGLFVEVR